MGVQLRLRSRDADAVEETWRRFVPSARLRRSEGTAFRFDWESATSDGLTVMDYALTADVRAVMRVEAQLFAGWIDGPGARLESRGHVIDARRPWLAPESELTAEWTGSARVRAFVFDRSACERVAQRMSGDDRLRLRVLRSGPVGEAEADAWRSTFAHVGASMLRARRLAHPLIEADLRRHALWMTLMTFHTTFAEAMASAAQRRPAGSTVRRARAFMDDHVCEPITVDDVAEAVGISTRGLQLAFKRANDESPMRYLRRARLAGARADLLAGVGAGAGSGTGAGVAEVAARWGFAHASRFAQYYREQYGELPAQTARR